MPSNTRSSSSRARNQRSDNPRRNGDAKPNPRRNGDATSYSKSTSNGNGGGARRTGGSKPRTQGSAAPRNGRSGQSQGRRGSSTPSVASALVRRPLDIALEAAAALPQPEVADFGGYGLPQALVTTLSRRGFSKPFAIQARTLPDALAGRDILARSQTGSGKTLAFGLPLVVRLAGAVRTPRRPRGLVLVPTRELAEQVTETLAPLGHAVDVRVHAVFGGTSIQRQVDALGRGVDVVVATPGRLVDLLDRKALTLDDVEVSILDEADYLADLGFLPVVMDLLGRCREDAHRMLFSATLDHGVDKVVARYLTDPALHAHAPDTASVAAMEHRAFEVRNDDKVALASEIATRPGRTLFFVRTKHGADRLAKQLQRAEVPAVAIHGNLNQRQRQRALDAFTRGESRVLVATDVAARGIHVDDVDLVVHFDPPNDHKDYLHRSGRTARAGAEGLVLSLLLPDQTGVARTLYTRAEVSVDGPHRVGPGHAHVRLVAESGEPIVVVPRPAGERSEGNARRSGSGSGSGPRRSGGAGRRTPSRASSGSSRPTSSSSSSSSSASAFSAGFSGRRSAG